MHKKQTLFAHVKQTNYYSHWKTNSRTVKSNVIRCKWFCSYFSLYFLSHLFCMFQLYLQDTKLLSRVWIFLSILMFRAGLMQSNIGIRLHLVIPPAVRGTLLSDSQVDIITAVQQNSVCSMLSNRLLTHSSLDDLHFSLLLKLLHFAAQLLVIVGQWLMLVCQRVDLILQMNYVSYSHKKI